MATRQTSSPGTAGKGVVRRPSLLYLLIGLQVLVALLMLIGGQGLAIPNANDPNLSFNVGFVIGIVDLVIVAGIWLGKRWGRSGVVVFALVGIGATILGMVQAYVAPADSALPQGASPLALTPTIVVELAILLVLTRPPVMAHFR